MFNPQKPFNELQLLPPKAKLETIAVMKQLVKSHQALAELKGYARTLPDQEILINSIILQEAKDSSEIENIVTTHDELFKGLSLQHNLAPEVKEVLNYRSALWEGYEFVSKKGYLSTNGILKIQERLVGSSAGIRKLPGTALKNERTGKIIYSPPDQPEVIRKLLKNFEDYLNTDLGKTDPLIKMAIAHYQFESIHPFYDGNGRTGRIIIMLYLVLEKLLSSPILYLSRYIIRNKSDYYNFLQKVTADNNWSDWIMYMLRAVEDTSRSSVHLISEILDSMKVTSEIMKKHAGIIYSKELLELLFEKPYVRVGNLLERGIASRNIASKYLHTLEGVKVLRSEKKGRDILYINIRLLDILKK
jgi:Fic family protein